jgi:DNA-binding MarR family transcriptional regulator
MRKNGPGRAPRRNVDETRFGEVLDFMRLLWAVDHGLQKISKRMRTEIGMTGPQRLVIRIVGRVPGISAGELARVLHLHPSTLTGILRRLELMGAIEREGDPKDARRALLKLTPQGRQIDNTRTGTVEAAVRRGLGKVADEDLAAAARVLRALATELIAANGARAGRRKR